MIGGVRKTGKILRTSEEPVPVVSDAGVAAADIGDGRVIPAVVLDTSARQDVEEYIVKHGDGSPGDILTTWGVKDRKCRKVVLHFAVQRPFELSFWIEFDPAKRGLVVDAALNSRAIYLQSGRVGSRFDFENGNGLVLAEVAARDFGINRDWEWIWKQSIARHLQKDRGQSRKDARRTATQIIKELRNTSRMRVW